MRHEHDLCRQEILRLLSSYGYLSTGCRENLMRSIRLVEKPAGTSLVTPGHTAAEFWYICRGLLKAYYLGSANREKVISFYAERELLLDVYLFFHEKNYPYYIRCMSNCILAELSQAQVAVLGREHPEFYRIALKLAGIANRKTVLRSRILQKEEGVLRYKAFCKWFSFHYRLSREDIASYLNISRSRLNHIILDVRDGKG